MSDRIAALTSYRSATGRFVSLAASLLVGAVLLQMSGISPASAYYIMFQESLTTQFGIQTVFVKMAPLLCVALALLIAFKAGIWNIGALGQVLIGALFAGQVGNSLNLPAGLLIPLEFLAGITGGAMWAFIPAVLRAKFEVNEVITTLLVNFIATYLTTGLVKGPLADPALYGLQTYTIYAAGRLPVLPIIGAHIGIVIVLAIAVGVHILLSKTTFGYQVAIFGASPRAAKYAGIKPARFVMTTFLLSGGLAGIAGMIELTGMTYRLQTGWVPTYGYGAVPLVFIAGLNSIAIIPASFLFAIFLAGGELMYAATGVPVYFVRALEGFILFFFAFSEVFNYTMKRARSPAG